MKMHEIEIDDAVWNHLKKFAEPFVDTPNSVLRRLLFREIEGAKASEKPFTVIDIKGLPIALSVVVGTLLGFTLLMVFAIKGKPQAGLPYLCSGAILGYLLSSYILFGRLVGLSSI